MDSFELFNQNIKDLRSEELVNIDSDYVIGETYVRAHIYDFSTLIICFSPANNFIKSSDIESGKIYSIDEAKNIALSWFDKNEV